MNYAKAKRIESRPAEASGAKACAASRVRRGDCAKDIREVSGESRSCRYSLAESRASRAHCVTGFPLCFAADSIRRWSGSERRSENTALAFPLGSFGRPIFFVFVIRFLLTHCIIRITESQMKTLATQKRAAILRCLIEGNSVRATVRITGAAKDTVIALLERAGEACLAYQDEHMRNLPCYELQMDEIWSFVGCREASKAKAIGHGRRFARKRK